MAFRTGGYWKSMANAVRENSNTFTTKFRMAKGDYFPLYVSVGMICVSASFGVYTVWHQLGQAPNVFLKKSRRETLPEVVEPERVAADAERFVKRSFFRKIAHIQDFDGPVRGDVFTRPVRVESLKDVGVDPTD